MNEQFALELVRRKLESALERTVVLGPSLTAVMSRIATQAVYSSPHKAQEPLAQPEFVGDAVLSLVVVDWYRRYAPQRAVKLGPHNRLFRRLVRNRTLGEAYLRNGYSEIYPLPAPTRANCMEAIFGATLLDFGYNDAATYIQKTLRKLSKRGSLWRRSSPVSSALTDVRWREFLGEEVVRLGVTQLLYDTVLSTGRKEIIIRRALHASTGFSQNQLAIIGDNFALHGYQHCLDALRMAVVDSGHLRRWTKDVGRLESWQISMMLGEH